LIIVKQNKIFNFKLIKYNYVLQLPFNFLIAYRQQKLKNTCPSFTIGQVYEEIAVVMGWGGTTWKCAVVTSNGNQSTCLWFFVHFPLKFSRGDQQA